MIWRVATAGFGAVWPYLVRSMKSGVIHELVEHRAADHEDVRREAAARQPHLGLRVAADVVGPDAGAEELRDPLVLAPD